MLLILTLFISSISTLLGLSGQIILNKHYHIAGRLIFSVQVFVIYILKRLKSYEGIFTGAVGGMFLYRSNIM
jgi:hypothetical protein